MTMDLTIKEKFVKKWEKYFPGSDLPIVCFYADELNGAEFPEAPKPNKRGYTCIFNQLAPVRLGKPRAFNQDNFGCWGATEFLGFGKEPTKEEMDCLLDFITKEEKFKKTNEHALASFAANPPLPAQGKYLIFKR